jgi:hypothetical protein
MERTHRAERAATSQAAPTAVGARDGGSAAFGFKERCEQCARVRASLLAGVPDSHHTHGMGTS